MNRYHKLRLEDGTPFMVNIDEISGCHPSPNFPCFTRIYLRGWNREFCYSVIIYYEDLEDLLDKRSSGDFRLPRMEEIEVNGYTIVLNTWLDTYRLWGIRDKIHICIHNQDDLNSGLASVVEKRGINVYDINNPRGHHYLDSLEKYEKYITENR